MSELRSLMVFLLRMGGSIVKFSIFLIGGLGALFLVWLFPLRPLFHLAVLLLGLIILVVASWALTYVSLGILTRSFPSVSWASKFRQWSNQCWVKFIGLVTNRLFVRSFLIEFLKGASFAFVFTLLSHAVPTDQTIRFGGDGDLSAERLILAFGLLFALLGSLVGSKKLK